MPENKKRRDPERFAGKINVPGAPVFLKDWTVPDQLTRNGAPEPSRHNSWGRPGKGFEADVAGKEHLKK